MPEQLFSPSIEMVFALATKIEQQTKFRTALKGHRCHNLPGLRLLALNLLWQVRGCPDKRWRLRRVNRFNDVPSMHTNLAPEVPKSMPM